MSIFSFFNKRSLIQLSTSVLYNANLKGFFSGTIWRGKSKYVCVPGLNCYSCPGAIGSCPIGSLQATLGSSMYKLSFYVVGMILFFSAIFGRFICGFLCPFGFTQDLLHKIKVANYDLPYKVHIVLLLLNYIILATLVILFPIFLTDRFGIAPPYFCQYICPMGTLSGGFPLISTNESLRSNLGFLFAWKLLLLILIFIFSTIIYRPFCKYICPLGAIYSLFNKFSFYQMNINKLKCTSCKECEKICKMKVKVTTNINTLECIRCEECKNNCKVGAIEAGFNIQKVDRDIKSLCN